MARSFGDYGGLSGVQSAAWTMDLPVAPPGKGVDGLFSLYESLGNVTISTDTVIDTVVDGPITVARYDTLTINAALTAANRCRGLVLLCEYLNIGATGNPNMKGKAPRITFNDDPRFPFVDITIPQKINIVSKYFSQAAFLEWLKKSRVFVGDIGFWQGSEHGLGDMAVTVTPGSIPIVSAAGCGDGGNGASSGATWIAGGAGVAGTNGGCGGGGGGAANGIGLSGGAAGAKGSPATPYGGGLGGGSGRRTGDTSATNGTSPRYSGIQGTGYDGPPTARPGGLLLVICRHDVVIASGGKFQSDAESHATYFGTPGGGNATLLYGGTLTNNGSITAAAGTTSGLGGLGGAGSAVAKTLAAMGLA